MILCMPLRGGRKLGNQSLIDMPNYKYMDGLGLSGFDRKELFMLSGWILVIIIISNTRYAVRTTFKITAIKQILLFVKCTLCIL